MDDHPGLSLDRRLRDAFDPDPRAAAGVAARALAERAARRRRGWLRVAAAVCPAAALVALAVALVRWPSAPAPQVEPTPVSLSGSFTDGLLTVPLPDGSVSITGGDVRLDRPQDGCGIVLVEGELR